MEKYGNRSGRESDNSTSDDEPDKEESEGFSDGKLDSSSVYTPNSNSPTWKWYVSVLFGVLLAVLVPIFCIKGSPSTWRNPHKHFDYDSSMSLEGKVKSHIQAWRVNYPNQSHETWNTIAGQLMDFAGIGETSPLVFVMAYDGAVKTTEYLASEISRAALYLKNGIDNCGDLDVAKISGSDKRIKPGFLLNDYIPQIEQCQKMLMFNLEELDGSAAKDLHSLLDPDYPHIHNVVYIFTVKIPNVDRNVYLEVQNTLRSHWGDTIEDDKLNPLLSRLVNNVKIFSEPVFEM